MRIGIVYLVTGAYCKFWNIFYTSMEKFFCIDADRGYEVFTDSSELLALEYYNVNFHRISDRGWVENVLSKSQCFCDIKDDLFQYDYLFYLNGNYKVFSEIKSKDILPTSSDGWLTALSYQHYENLSPDDYPYDRNPSSQAYIPYGQGEFYYQGGFYGGRTEEMLLMADFCRKQIRVDLTKGVIARFHDESYVNKYLLNRSPKRLDEEYAYHQIWPYKGIYRAVFLNHYEYLGEAAISAQEGKFAEEVNLEKIANNVMLYGSFVRKLGLFHGKMGIILFLYAYARFSKEKLWEDFANDFLDGFIEQLVVSNLSLVVQDGLAGIGIGIEYLVQQHYLEGDTDEILEEMDKKIMECAPTRLLDYSLATGVEGIICYVLCRLSVSHKDYFPFCEEFLNEMKQVCRSSTFLLFDGRMQELCIAFMQDKEIGEFPFDMVFDALFMQNAQINEMSWQSGLKEILRK